MRMQIRTLQTPNRGYGAFCPTLTPNPTANSNGQNVVTGFPGTMPVASPRPPALNDEGLGGPFNQPSSCAPDYIMPTIYVAHENRTLRFPGKLLSDNVMPVPARNPGRVARNAFAKTRVGGRKVTASNRPWTQWPTYGGGSQ